MRYAARTTTAPRLSLLWVAYLVAGAIVASTHHYFDHVHTLKAIGSAILAVALWPLLFLGINLHIH